MVLYVKKCNCLLVRHYSDNVMFRIITQQDRLPLRARWASDGGMMTERERNDGARERREITHSVILRKNRQ